MYKEQYKSDVTSGYQYGKDNIYSWEEDWPHKITHGLTANPYDEFVFHPKEHWKKISTKWEGASCCMGTKETKATI